MSSYSTNYMTLISFPTVAMSGLMHYSCPTEPPLRITSREKDLLVLGQRLSYSLMRLSQKNHHLFGILKENYHLCHGGWYLYWLLGKKVKGSICFWVLHSIVWYSVVQLNVVVWSSIVYLCRINASTWNCQKENLCLFILWAWVRNSKFGVHGMTI